MDASEETAHALKVRAMSPQIQCAQHADYSRRLVLLIGLVGLLLPFMLAGMLQDGFGYAFPAGVLRLPLRVHVMGWDYQRYQETCHTAQDIRTYDQNPGMAVWPLRKVGSVPILLGLGAALPVYSLTTQERPPLVLFVRRSVACYVIYAPLGNPSWGSVSAHQAMPGAGQ
jgi:hypothetical protein